MDRNRIENIASSRRYSVQGVQERALCQERGCTVQEGRYTGSSVQAGQYTSASCTGRGSTLLLVVQARQYTSFSCKGGSVHQFYLYRRISKLVLVEQEGQ